jgi:hypothetical protein
MAAVSPSSVSDTKMSAVTGKPRGEWFALLDAENAATWPHPDIAAWLHREHGVDGWWAQGITVAYEQARGRRMPGQQSDGTFAAGASKTVEGELLAVLDRVIALVSDHVGLEPVSVSHAAKHPTARWNLADGTGVLATLSPGPAGSVRKCRIALTRLRLDPERLGPEKEQLTRLLTRFDT